MEFVKRLFKTDPKSREAEADKARSKTYATDRILESILADIAHCNSEIMPEHIKDFLKTTVYAQIYPSIDSFSKKKKQKLTFLPLKCPIF